MVILLECHKPETIVCKRTLLLLQEPFECYKISDIESGLGLKRNQMIAIALLVGNDHDLHGVLGVGVDTALRLVRLFSEDEIFDRYTFLLESAPLLLVSIY